MMRPERTSDERELIGSILDDGPVGDGIARPTSAPPHLRAEDGPSASSAYFTSQQTLEPRLGSPMYDVSNWKSPSSASSRFARGSSSWGTSPAAEEDRVCSPLDLLQSDYPSADVPAYERSMTPPVAKSKKHITVLDKETSSSFTSPFSQNDPVLVSSMQSMSIQSAPLTNTTPLTKKKPSVASIVANGPPARSHPLRRPDARPIPSSFTHEKEEPSLLLYLKGNSKGPPVLSIDDVIRSNQVAHFAVDQNGSRFIQQHLEQCKDSHKQAIFMQLEPNVLMLCGDVFGNYVIQKFFDFGLPQHKVALVDKLRSNFMNLALQMYGCRVVQKALETVEEEQQVILVSELRGHVMKCIKDQNGNHVIQKCIERVAPQHISFIIDAFKGHVFGLSTHAYGCRVVQRLLEYCNASQKKPILSEILQRVLDLVMDQYGNYVVQHVLQRGESAYRASILKAIAGHILTMSKHKFASNVIEKCFAYATHEQRSALITEMVGTDEFCPLAEMVKDQYANYVVQKVLGVVNEAQRDRLIDTMRTRVPNLRKITYGKHIVSRVEKLTGKTVLVSGGPRAPTNCEMTDLLQELVSKRGDRPRFLMELEFVEMLASPKYLQFLAQSKYLEDPCFLNYLEYLQYWTAPAYIHYITHPHCIYFLELLQKPAFRMQLLDAGYINHIHDLQYWHWKNPPNKS